VCPTFVSGVLLGPSSFVLVFSFYFFKTYTALALPSPPGADILLLISNHCYSVEQFYRQTVVIRLLLFSLLLLVLLFFCPRALP
jgi:hypothetical protein